MRKIFYLLILLISVNKFFSQLSQPEPIVRTLDMFPKTPDAAALSKYIDIPPGSYTGVANFTIPLYTINVDGIKVPIELQYTTTGIKVSEIASRVGLGWALNVGPSLTQQVIGNRDKTTEKPKLISADDIPDVCMYDGFVASYGFDIPCGIALSAIGLYPFARPINPDLLPDIFSYSLLNDSGQFIFDFEGLVGIPRPYNLIKINPLFYYSALNGIKMTDEKGVSYIFKDNVGLKEIMNKTTCNPSNEDDDIPNFKLDTIITSNNKKIVYKYGKAIQSKYITSISENRVIDMKIQGPSNHANPYDLPAQRCVNKTETKDRILTEISFEDGKVRFYYNNDALAFSEHIRQDLIGDAYLTRVVVEDKKGKIIKDISLSYDYFITNDSVPSLYGNIFSTENTDMYKRRLKLTKVRDNLTLGEHKLQYYGDLGNIPLPNRMSFSQDYWGVYNGKENESPIATVRTGNLHSNKEKVYLGANKLPDINYGIIGNLQKITYPTGGTTEITYEADDHYNEIYNPAINEYVEHFSEEVDLYSPYIEFEILNDGLPVYNQSVILEDFDCPENSQTPATTSTPQWELWKKNSPGTGFTRVGFGDVCTKTVDREDGPGIYRLRVYEQAIDGGEIPPTGTRTIKAKYSWINEVRVNNSQVNTIGTIRVKQIESNSADNGKIIRKYTYKNPATNLSSGLNQGEEVFVPLSLNEKNSRPVINSGQLGSVLRYLTRSNNPGWQINTVRGKSVGYEYVQEIYQSSDEPSQNYKKESKYFHGEDIIPQYEPWKLVKKAWPQKNLDAGLLLEEKLFKSNGDTIKVSKMEYQSDPYFNQFATMNPYPSPYSYLIAVGLDISVKKIDTGTLGEQYYYFNREDFNISNTWIKTVRTTTTEYVDNQPKIVTEQTTAYSTNSGQNRHTFPETQTSTVVGSNVTTSQHYKYAHDLNSYLKEKNIISIPLETEVKKNDVVISKTETKYPTSQTEANQKTLGLPLPCEALSKNLWTGNMEQQISYGQYDNKGNLLQYTTKDGVPVSIIWGYHQTQPIAKIEGATYVQVLGMATAIINASNADADYGTETSENDLLTALDNFRTNSGYQTTTYSYDPLIGVRSITPPSGIREYYIYDAANRLKEVKDINGNTLKEYQYHYKP